MCRIYHNLCPGQKTTVEGANRPAGGDHNRQKQVQLHFKVVVAVGGTHRFLQADLLELSHSGAEQRLQNLLPLLKSRHALRLQLAVRAALNICKETELKWEDFNLPSLCPGDLVALYKLRASTVRQ